ncbi:MAG: DUF4038 domain-containing protein [Caldilineaceae bacterium]
MGAFHRLTHDEASDYFADRQAKRFNVIQAVALAEEDGLNTPNRSGERPLIDNDPATPNDAYFDFVDALIRDAAAHDLYVGFLPTWGDKVTPMGGGAGRLYAGNAGGLRALLGRRFGAHTNVIWIRAGIVRRSLRAVTCVPSGEPWRRASTPAQASAPSRRITPRAACPPPRNCTRKRGWT